MGAAVAELEVCPSCGLRDGHHDPKCRWRRPIEELGYWEGMTWVFYEPFLMPDGHQIRRLDLSQMTIPESVLAAGITPADIVYALTDPDAIVAEEDDGLGDAFTRWPDPG